MGEYFPDLPQRQLNQMGDVNYDPVHLTAEEFQFFHPVDFLWGRSSGTSGEHPLGLALDHSGLEYGNGVNDPGPMRRQLCIDIADRMWRNRRRLGVWYVIWDRKISSTNRNSYAFNSSDDFWAGADYRGSNPHTDHVHTSFYAANVYQPPEGLMSWDENAAPVSNYEKNIIPASWADSAKRQLIKAAAALAYLKEVQFAKPYFPDEGGISLSEMVRWSHSRLKRGEDTWERTEAKVDALLDAHAGAGSDEIKAHIDQRHAEASAERQALADKVDAVQTLLAEHADGSLDAEQVVARMGELLAGATVDPAGEVAPRGRGSE